MKPLNTFAQCVIRGWANYPDGHLFAHEYIRMRKNRTLLGRIPINDKLIYWFVAQLSAPFGKEDPILLFCFPFVICTFNLNQAIGWNFSNLRIPVSKFANQLLPMIAKQCTIQLNFLDLEMITD
jgi:hypothetical protein